MPNVSIELIDWRSCANAPTIFLFDALCSSLLFTPLDSMSRVEVKVRYSRLIADRCLLGCRRAAHRMDTPDHAPSAAGASSQTDSAASQLQLVSAAACPSASTDAASLLAAQQICAAATRSPLATMQMALELSQSVSADKKVQLFTFTLVHDRRLSTAVDVMRLVLWSALLRLHAQLHPCMADKLRPVALRQQLLNSEHNVGTVLTEKMLTAYHKEWKRLSPLLSSEDDELRWARWTGLPSFAQRVSLNKLRALAEQQSVWACFSNEQRWDCFIKSLTEASNPQQIAEKCQQFRGQQQAHSRRSICCSCRTYSHRVVSVQQRC